MAYTNFHRYNTKYSYIHSQFYHVNLQIYTHFYKTFQNNMEYAIHRVMSDTDYNANKEEE